MRVGLGQTLADGTLVGYAELCQLANKNASLLKLFTGASMAANKNRGHEGGRQQVKPEWDTPAKRVAWLVQTVAKGNQSQFAARIQLSHTAVSKVVHGKPPGRKLLAAIAEHVGVNSSWLLTGRGQPFLEGAAPGEREGLPVADQPLPGSPQECRDLLSGRWLETEGKFFAPSQYWLRLAKGQPIVRDPQHGYRAGDLLLMETNRALFPREESIGNDLCVLRFPGAQPPLKMGVVFYFDGNDDDPPSLCADTFDLTRDPKQVVREQVYRHYPGGEVTYHEVPMKRTTFRGNELFVPLDAEDLAPAWPAIEYSAIVAVWTGLLHRTGGVPWAGWD